MKLNHFRKSLVNIWTNVCVIYYFFYNTYNKIWSIFTLISFGFHSFVNTNRKAAWMKPISAFNERRATVIANTAKHLNHFHFTFYYPGVFFIIILKSFITNNIVNLYCPKWNDTKCTHKHFKFFIFIRDIPSWILISSVFSNKNLLTSAFFCCLETYLLADKNIFTTALPRA